jgi:hypothetical protein
MSTPDLFAEMDHLADVLRENDPTLRESLCDELQLEFRQLQKRRMPTLSKDEFLDLFHVWLDHYLAKLEISLAEVRNRIAVGDRELQRLIAERHRLDPSRDVFICVCGEVIADPFSAEALEKHSPHFVAASLDRVEEGLKRWRAAYGIK